MIQISSAATLADPLLLAQIARTQNSTSFALLTVALFDYVITLPREWACIWQRRASTLTVLLFTLRYGALSYGIVSVGCIFVTAPETCLVLVRITQTLLVFLMVLFGVGSTLRVYALSKRPEMCILTAVLATGQVISNVYEFTHSVAITTSVPSATCVSHLESSIHLQTILGMSARSATALADVVVLAVTLRATIHSFNASKRMNFQLPLITTLVRDGAFYFVIVLVMNVLQMILYPIKHEFYLTAFIGMITPILLARLFLDLREAVDGRPIDGSETITDINHFSRFSAPDIDHSIELNSRDKQADPNGPIRFRSTRERPDSWSLSDVDPQEAAGGQGHHG